MLLRPFRSFSSVSSFTHTLDNGIVKVEPAKPEQLSTHGKGTKFAVVMVQGKQYRVSAGDCIMTDKIGSVEVGQKIDLDEVLLVGSQDLTVVGQPLVDGVKIAATVEEHSQTEKVHVFKKKRRKGYKRRFGHRSDVTVLRIDSVEFDESVAAAKQ